MPAYFRPQAAQRKLARRFSFDSLGAGAVWFALAVLGIWSAPAGAAVAQDGSTGGPQLLLPGSADVAPQARAAEPTPARAGSAGAPRGGGPRWRSPAGISAPAGEAVQMKIDAGGQPKPAAKEPALLEEPVSASTQAAAEAGAAEQAPAAAATPGGQALLLKAYARSREAADEAGFSETIDLCSDGIQAGVSEEAAAYARKLMAWAHNRRGELHAAAGRDDLAYEDFNAALELDDQSWRALHNRGVQLAAAGKNKQALEDFNAALELHREFPMAYYNRAEVRYDLGDFEGALADYNAAARRLPEDAEVFNSRGHLLHRLRHYKQAVADFNKTLKLNPKSAEAHVSRGDVYGEMGRYGDALADYHAAIELRPGLGRAHQSLAWLLATCPVPQFRDPQVAVEAAQEALKIDGATDYHYLATLAAAYASAGRFDSAEKVQRQVLRSAPAESRPVQERRLALYHSRRPFRTTPPEMMPTAASPPPRDPTRQPMTTGVRAASGYVR